MMKDETDLQELLLSKIDCLTPYNEGYQVGIIGINNPDHNPYESQTRERYEWGEGFFDGYKEYLKEEK